MIMNYNNIVLIKSKLYKLRWEQSKHNDLTYLLLTTALFRWGTSTNRRINCRIFFYRQHLINIRLNHCDVCGGSPLCRSLRSSVFPNLQGKLPHSSIVIAQARSRPLMCRYCVLPVFPGVDLGFLRCVRTLGPFAILTPLCLLLDFKDVILRSAYQATQSTQSVISSFKTVHSLFD